MQPASLRQTDLPIPKDANEDATTSFHDSTKALAIHRKNTA